MSVDIAGKKQVVVRKGGVLPPNRTSEELWRKRVAELTKFQEETGHCTVSRRNTRYPGLGLWIMKMRKRYRLRQEGGLSYLTDDKIAQLESLGFDWKPGKGKGGYKQQHVPEATIVDNVPEAMIVDNVAGSDKTQAGVRKVSLQHNVADSDKKQAGVGKVSLQPKY